MMMMMIGVFVRRITAAATALMMVAAMTVAAAAPAQAADANTCQWQEFGVRSNCDEQPRTYQACHTSVEVPTPASSYSRTFESGVYWMSVTLLYSTVCRTVYAALSAGPTKGEYYPGPYNCYVKVERNSDRKVLYAGFRPDYVIGNGYAETNMLDDHGVTSFAWAHCAWYGGPTLRGGTANW